MSAFIFIFNQQFATIFQTDELLTCGSSRHKIVNLYCKSHWGDDLLFRVLKYICTLRLPPFPVPIALSVCKKPRFATARDTYKKKKHARTCTLSHTHTSLLQSNAVIHNGAFSKNKIAQLCSMQSKVYILQPTFCSWAFSFVTTENRKHKTQVTSDIVVSRPQYPPRWNVSKARFKAQILTATCCNLVLNG